jgi:hypothetical protein
VRRALTVCSGFAEGRQHLHKHLHLILFISPFLAELMRRVNFQLCHRKEARSSKKVQSDPTAINCNVCGAGMFPNPGTAYTLVATNDAFL